MSVMPAQSALTAMNSVQIQYEIERIRELGTSPISLAFPVLAAARVFSMGSHLNELTSGDAEV
jgi:hypothetical protein